MIWVVSWVVSRVADLVLKCWGWWSFFLGNFSGNASFFIYFYYFFKILVICNFSTVRSIFSNMQSVTVSSLALGKCFTEAQQILWCDLHLNRWMKSLKAKSYLSLQKMLKKNHIEQQREKHQNTLDVPEWSWNIQLCMNGLSHFVPLYRWWQFMSNHKQCVSFSFTQNIYKQSKEKCLKCIFHRTKTRPGYRFLSLFFPNSSSCWNFIFIFLIKSLD